MAFIKQQRKISKTISKTSPFLNFQEILLFFIENVDPHL